MKQRSAILNLLFAAIILSSCQKENMGDCFKSTGSIHTETRNLESFNRLEVEDNINVYIRFGSEHKAEVEAGKNLLSLIETEIENGTLFIRNNNKCNWVRDFKKQINITLYCENLSELIARGFGTIETLDVIEQTHFYAEQWLASGVVKLKLNTNETYLKSHTGPADYECSGSSDFLYVYNSSQGIMDMQQLAANDAYVWNKGTGNIYVNVADSLEMRIEYVGNVHYTGNPDYVNATITHDGEAVPF